MLKWKQVSIVFVMLLTSLLLRIQVTQAAACADGDVDACWARFYVAGDSDESRVYFRIFRACTDGIRIGIATNIVDEYEFYIKQYGSGENPQFRLLTEPTTVQLNDYPAGIDIEATDESASGFTEVATVYFVKVFNVGWSEAFDPDYTDGIMIGSTGYGYSEDDGTGIVRSGDFDTCWTYNAPFENFVAPFVQCVVPGPNGTLSAVFGYYNRLRYDAIIPAGPYNSIARPFNTAPLPFIPPSNFERGVHYNAFRVSGTALSYTWTVEGASARATRLSPRCRS
jgi:hypothetical protein